MNRSKHRHGGFHARKVVAKEAKEYEMGGVRSKATARRLFAAGSAGAFMMGERCAIMIFRTVLEEFVRRSFHAAGSLMGGVFIGKKVQDPHFR